MHSQVVIPGKLKLSINPKRNVFHYFSLGEITNGNLFKAEKKCRYTVNIHVVKNPKDRIKTEYSKFSTFYSVGEDWIFYERKYGGFKCELFVDGLISDNINIYVNHFYMNYVKAKIDSLWPVGIHATDILMYKMLADGDLIIHGASLQNSQTKKSFLLVAPPDTGKTYTTFKLLEKGYKFLGEDLSYYDRAKDSLVCMPYTSTWGHRFKLQAIDLSKIPFLGLLSNQNKKGVEDIFGRNSVIKSAPLDRIYILEKSDGKKTIKKVKPRNELLRKVMAIQRNEFSYYKNPLLRAFEYYHSINLDKIYSLEATNTAELFRNKELYVLRAPRYEDYEQMILNHSST